VAGLVAARTLSSYPEIEIELFERHDRLGGLHQSVELNGLMFDIGAFEFSPDHELILAFPEILKHYLTVQQVNHVVTPTGHLSPYPFSIASYLQSYGRLDLLLALASGLVGRLLYRQPHSLDAWVRFYIGNRFYRKTGLQAYIERLYGNATKQVDIEFARVRLVQIEALGSLAQVARQYLTPALRAQFAPPQQVVPPSPGSLSGGGYLSLVRPRQGFSYVYDGMIKPLLQAAGVAVTTSCQVGSIRRDPQGFRIETDRGVTICDRVISTLPLQTSARLCGLATGQAYLKYQPMVSLFYSFRGTIHSDATILYNFTQTGSWKRVVVLSRYYGQHQGQDYFTVEVPDGAATPIAGLTTAFEQQITALNLMTGTFQDLGHATTSEAYPLYRVDTMAELRQTQAALRAFGIDLVGRQAEFSHIGSSETARRARQLATALGGVR
jgi:protoporphyrinogen oxidase